MMLSSAFRRRHICFLLSALLFAAVFLIGLSDGSADIPAGRVWRMILTGEGASYERYIVLSLRLPSMLTAAFTGASLAAAGLILQTLFSNPLADPGILGISSGASLGVAVATMLLGGGLSAAGFTLTGFSLTVAAAMAGALAILLLLSLFAAALRSSVRLLIAGIMTGYLVSAAVGLLSATASAEGIHSYIFWGLGSYLGVGPSYIVPFCLSCILALLLSLLTVKPLNALLLGPLYAANLGLDLRRIRLLLLLLTGVLTAVPTAFCGPVAFIGLAVPHIARFSLLSSDHRILLPYTMLLGALTSVASNVICSTPHFGIMIPLNVVTSIWGAPVILWVILSSRDRAVG